MSALTIPLPIQLLISLYIANSTSQHGSSAHYWCLRSWEHVNCFSVFSRFEETEETAKYYIEVNCVNRITDQ